MANWAKGLDALGAGLLRQADIGGRAYEGAMAKEAEARAESRALSAERRALIAAKAKEERDKIEWTRREGIQAETAADAAAALQAGRETVTGMGTASSEKIAALGQSGANKRAQMLTDANINAAKLLADERGELVTKRRTWAVEDAISKATSDKAIKIIEASVSRAKAEEDNLKALYEGLKDAGVVWDEKTQSYTSGSDYMDQIHRAQERVAAAWRDTGITSLMSERNINEPKFSYLSRSIVSGISYELKEKKPEIWKAIVEGLNSDKGSSDYKEAIKTITPYLNDAIKESSIRTTSTEKKSIIKEIIEGIGMVADYDQLKEDLGDGNTGETQDVTPVASGFFEAGRIIDTLSELGDEELSNYLRLGALAEAEAMESGRGRINTKQMAINSAKNRDPHHLLAVLKGIIGKGAYDKTKVENLINKLEMWIKNSTSSQEVEPNSSSPLQNRFNSGMLNTGGGMISSAGLSPEALAQWEPEAVEARQQQRMA